MYIISSSGFFTAKGSLVSSIMYPQPLNFRFNRDAAKFLVILGVIGKRTYVCFSLSFYLWDQYIYKNVCLSSAICGTVYSFVVLYRSGVSVVFLLRYQTIYVYI